MLTSRVWDGRRRYEGKNCATPSKICKLSPLKLRFVSCSSGTPTHINPPLFAPDHQALNPEHQNHIQPSAQVPKPQTLNPKPLPTPHPHPFKRRRSMLHSLGWPSCMGCCAFCMIGASSFSLHVAKMGAVPL